MSRCRFSGVQGLFDVNIYAAIGYFVLLITQEIDVRHFFLTEEKGIRYL